MRVGNSNTEGALVWNRQAERKTTCGFVVEWIFVCVCMHMNVLRFVYVFVIRRSDVGCATDRHLNAVFSAAQLTTATVVRTQAVV